MAYHISIGSSGNEALAEWRAAGGTFGNQAWRALYGQVSDTLLRMPDQAALDPTMLPSGPDYATWSMGRGGQYATDVNVAYMDQETGLRATSRYTYVTDTPHTPEEAQDAALADFGSDENAQRYGQTITGAFAVHIYQTVAWSE